MDKRHKILLVENGFGILRTCSEHSHPLTLGELAVETGLHRSQLYRYLNTFAELGLLTRLEGEDHQRWQLGPELIALAGRAFLGIDIVSQAESELVRLRDRMGESVALSIWQDRGPLFIRWEKSHRVISVELQAGSFIPLYTATGKVFRAFLPEHETRGVYEREILHTGLVDVLTYQEDIERVRQTHISVSRSSLKNGVAAIATPIFQMTGELAGVMTIVGVLGQLDLSEGGKPIMQLLRAAQSVSYKMGYVTSPNDYEFAKV